MQLGFDSPRPDMKLSLSQFRNIWRFLRDPKTSWKPKVLAIFALAYVLWTIDLIPDIIPFFGWIDDLGLTFIVFWYLARIADRQN
jgi:uncharacterized membrane protein YkvA (DUF1232 family)